MAMFDSKNEISESELIQPSAIQQEMILKQLGREPQGMVGIAVQNEQGVPLVLQMELLLDDKPFPTLYWLSSKDVYQAIAEIETAGVVKELEQELENNPELLERHLADQQRYVDLRWASASEQQKQRIEELGFLPLYSKYGIGGISQWDKIRCLHMHYAYHLVQGTALGALLDQRYSLNEIVRSAQL